MRGLHSGQSEGKKRIRHHDSPSCELIVKHIIIADISKRLTTIIV